MHSALFDTLQRIDNVLNAHVDVQDWFQIVTLRWINDLSVQTFAVRSIYKTFKIISVTMEDSQSITAVRYTKNTEEFKSYMIRIQKTATQNMYIAPCRTGPTRQQTFTITDEDSLCTAMDENQNSI